MKRAIIIFLAFILIGGSGCLGKISDSPLTPSSVIQSAGSSANSHMPWGFWQVAIDTESANVEIVPIRAGLFHANVVTYLQPPSPIGMGVHINELNMVTGVFDLNVSLTHPFQDPSFTGFDVKGIFIAQGSNGSIYDPSLKFPAPDESRLLNSDGWTRWWNPQEFTDSGLTGYTEGIMGTSGVNFHSTLNPFKYFSDQLDPTQIFDGALGSRNEFSSGATNIRQYIIRFELDGGSPLVVFNYAVDACWESPDGDPHDISNFPPEANQPEPYYISVTDLGSSPWYSPESGSSGGDLHLQLTIKDYGISSPADVTNELSEIVLESQTLFPDLITIPAEDYTSQFGNTVLFDVDILDVTPDSTADQEILIHIVTASDTYNQGFGSDIPNADLAAYKVYAVQSIAPLPPPPTGLTADVTRDSNGKLNGFTLDWLPAAASKEYVVYWSTNPYAENPDWETDPVGSIIPPLTSWQYSVAGAELNGQWMLHVVSRGVYGVESTASCPSNDAFIDLCGFENYVEDDENKWRIRETNGPSYNVFMKTTTESKGVDGSESLVVGPKTWFARHSTTYCVTPQLPEIDGASTCFFEFSHKRPVNFPFLTLLPYTGEYPYGYSICSASMIDDPEDPMGTLPFLQIDDFRLDTVSEDDFISGVGMSDYDDYYIEGLHYRYNDPVYESDDPANGWTGPALIPPVFQLSRYYIPKVIAENHPFAGICWGGKQFGTGLDPNYNPTQWLLICDEFALIIY